MGFDYSLSASKLGVLLDCERCFYDANMHKVSRQRGIFPSLPGGVDRVSKNYLDQFRGQTPPHLIGQISGRLWGTSSQITKLRNWRSGLKSTLTIRGKTVGMIGALDDLIIEDDGSYSPYDVKTKGAEPTSDGSEYYQGQLDVYALLLRENGMMPSGKAYLDYWFPISQDGMAMSWSNRLFTLTADHGRAVDVLDRAVAVLSGEQPDPSDGCEYCSFVVARMASTISPSRK